MDQRLLVDRENMLQGEWSMSDISGTSDNRLRGEKSLQGSGQFANSERFHSRIIISVDSLSGLGET
jgi:hypothetical protein